ncbi:MAG: altronate dehydratase family protein [Polyangiaceae bacterium]
MSSATQSAQSPVLRLHPRDNVGVALRDLERSDEAEGLRPLGEIPAGHKLALSAIEAGQPVLKFGQIIGFAEGAIQRGEHVHVHNCKFAQFDRETEIGRDYRATELVPEAERATFQGIVRRDGRVATRNYIGVMTTVNCSATVARAIVERVRQRVLPSFPNVDDVVAFTHGDGCAIGSSGETIDTLRRTMTGYLKHPNMSGMLVLGLGCETNQGTGLLEHARLEIGPNLKYLTIQGAGGSQRALDQGIAALTEMLPEANAVKRETVPAKHLIVGLQCGGSDGYSGISANPALGAAADLLVRHGGTPILSETPEIYGAEQLLLRRAASPQVAAKLKDCIRWWEEHVRATGGSMDNNPSTGNKRGGLTTILEKSLGAVAKGGTSGLMDVYRYAEPITTHGFVFMDSPGYDPASVTGQVASGANLICFTTGRGSVFGCKPAPSLKLSTNTALYERMPDDIDIDCGVVLDKGASIQDLGRSIFQRLLEVASGSQTKSEAFGFGDNEFVPWRIGALM